VINGAINANGQVILVNSSGVVFGKGAEVNAAAVTASTLNIADQEFMDGKATFKDDGSGVGGKAGKIINKGTIRTNQTDPTSTEGGFIALLAPEVRNQGVLLAQKGGTVAIGSGNQITLTIQGQSLVAIKVDEAAYNGLISNKHIIEAPGGLVVLATSAANQLMAGIIKNTGRISANSLVNNGGTIELVAKNITQSGQITSNSQTGQGGQINLTGQDITIAKNSSTTATGATGGGQVNIGLANTQVSGGTQTNTSSQQTIKANADQAAKTGQLANTVTIQEGATIDTSATQTGNGGSIAIWSQVQTTVAGILKSMGGALSGNGGFIETSSKGAVSLAPTVSINTSANNATGKAGTWLLDPVDLTIDASTANLISQILANSNVTIAVTNSTTSCSIGSCTQSGTSSLTIASGADILKAGNNYTTLTLSSSGIFNLNANISGQNLDVIIQSSIAYLNVGSSINASKVTVQAQTINAQGSIQTSNYLSNNLGSLGNAIQLLAQAIYVSGRLSANASLGVAGRIELTANTITLSPGATLEANGDEGGVVTIAANDANFTSATIQANGGNGRGGTLLLTAANNQYFTNASLLANGTTDGGAITITTASGDIYFTNSLIQTNGSTGRGGSIGLSATNSTVIANSTISANGYSQGGSIKIGNDATNGSLPFSIYTSIDELTTISAAQLDPNPANQQGGFIETSGHTLNLLSSINAGRGGMWLLDPYDYTITSTQALFISNALKTGNVTISVTGASSNNCSITGSTCPSGSSGSGNLSLGTSSNSIAITRASGGPSPTTLTLNAYGNISIYGTITATAGSPLNVDIYAGVYHGSFSPTIYLSPSSFTTAAIYTANGRISFGGSGSPSSSNAIPDAAVVLQKDTKLDSGTGAITFSSTLNGTNSLTIAHAGDVNFLGAVGSTNNLDVVVIASAGNTQISGSFVVNSVTITSGSIAGSGDIDTTGASSGSGAGGDGGVISISAAGSIALHSLTSNGGASTYGYSRSSRSYDGGAGGDISLSGTSIVISGNIAAQGGASASGSDGSAGLIMITNSSASISSSVSGIISGLNFIKAGAGTLILTGANTYSGTTTISAGVLVFENNAPALSSSQYIGPGSLVIRSSSTSFSSSYTFNESTQNLGSLTIGKDGNTADITIGASIASSGPATIYGKAVNVNQNIATND
jgi:autotransporter-associated beta strand protein